MIEQSTIGTKEEVVLTYSKSVQRLARQLTNLKLYDRWLHEDLIQQGFVGLLEAYERYDSNKIFGHFWGYARKSVRGRMIDFIAQYFNYLRPTKQVNAIMLQILNKKLRGETPEVIADLCGCSQRIAVDALHLLVIRRPIYLYEPIRNNENLRDKEYIDLIEIHDEQDELSFVENNNEPSDLENKVIRLLLNGYSRENILEHTNIQAIELKVMIDKIIMKYGNDPKTILNRNEERLMKISSIEEQTTHLQEVTQQYFEWVDINKISASPKNPRKNLSANSQQMKEIISTKGWEEPITCYKRGPYYFVLSGHRRWSAAKELGEKELPVFVVVKPKDQADELDRLGSLQSGQVEWTPYESAKNTYDRWLYSGGISYYELGKKLGITKNRVAAKIHVFKYYPKEEIADKLANGMYSISMLDYIAHWIKRLSHYQPELVNDLSEEHIRHLMLTKYENKCFNSHLINDKTFVTNATKEELYHFLCDANKTLKQCQVELILNRSNQNIASSEASSVIKDSQIALRNMVWSNDKEAQRLIDELDKLASDLTKKIIELAGGV